MSFQAMATAIKIKTGHSSSKSILLFLANYADENNECFPSIRRIADDTEMCPRTVKTWIAKLEELGFITIEYRFKNGKQTSSKYRLQISHTQQSANSAPLQSANNVTTECKSCTQNLSLEPITLLNNTEEENNGKRTRLESDWKLSAEQRKFAEERGLSDRAIDDQEELFRTYWLNAVAAKAKKLDWSATWRAWIINSERFGNNIHPANNRASSGKGNSVYDKSFEAAARVVKKRAERRGDF